MAYRHWQRRPERPLWRRVLDLLGFLIVVTAVVIAMQRFGLFDAGSGLVEVVDGDSLRIANAEIRLQGIDAPEYRQLCQDAEGRDYACGKEARRALQSLVRNVVLDCTSMEADQYGRALSTCRTHDTHQDVARELVLQGWALAYRSQKYAVAEAAARRDRRGLWAGQFERPATYRSRERLTRGSLGAEDTADAGE